ncbi:phage baseplate assembly protein V [Sinobacterium caligoides]|uniref:Phage baseplate assembly protein V n=1 Tax=Sinobacterium caligoides TaxID=933926 RepID=A0A3N2E0W9_9GAMM|nr:phage baseplate assembly protein V [Sinobacterium caligoides]ROS05677.1 phage baseplate assembly protein V [Sinobacterium caligoides]
MLMNKLCQIHAKVSDLVVIGRVVDSTDKEKKEKKDEEKEGEGFVKQVVLVEIGEAEEGRSVRLWMPWLAPRAGEDLEYWKPQLDEQVCIVVPSGDLQQGIIVGSLYSDKHDFNKGNMPDESYLKRKEAGKIHSRIYGDGTQIDYDKEKHIFELNQRYEPGGELGVDVVSTLQENSSKILVNLKNKYSLEINEVDDSSSFLVDLNNKCRLEMKEASDSSKFLVNLNSKRCLEISEDGDSSRFLVDLNGKCSLEINEDGDGSVDVKVDKKVRLKLSGDGTIYINAEKIKIVADVEVKGKLDVIE